MAKNWINYILRKNCPICLVCWIFFNRHGPDQVTLSSPILTVL